MDNIIFEASTILLTRSDVKYWLLPSWISDVLLSFKFTLYNPDPSPINRVDLILPATSNLAVGSSTPIPTYPRLLITNMLLSSLYDALNISVGCIPT